MPATRTKPRTRNQERGDAALEALIKFARVNGSSIDREGLGTVIVDFLTNLAHLCDQTGIGLAPLLGSAAMHYRAESDQAQSFTPVPPLGS